MVATCNTPKSKRKLPPCRVACPAGVNVQGYVTLLQQGKFKESVELVRKSIPFPAICGRVCYSPCEEACARKNVDEPVSIRALKLLMADIEREQGQVKPEPIRKTHAEKVAIVGAGPTGLSAAYELAKLGYPVTVFEAMPEPGGMMRYFIPDSRLRKEVVVNEIAYIRDLGVVFHTGVLFGKDLSIDSLKSDGYKAIFIATGIQKVWIKKLVEQETALSPRRLGAETIKAPFEMPSLTVDQITLETPLAGVFAGGDMITGKASSIIKAIGAGKRAAMSIDLYLNGKDMKAGREEVTEEATWVKDWKRMPKKPKRYASPRMDAGRQKISFEKAQELLAKTKEAAMFEARRCLVCSSCAECLGNELLCETDKAIVNESSCIGCNICVEVCAFGAINKNEKGVAQVKDDLCKGCGACSASCPERAITMQRLTDERIMVDVLIAMRQEFA